MCHESHRMINFWVDLNLFYSMQAAKLTSAQLAITLKYYVAPISVRISQASTFMHICAEPRIKISESFRSFQRTFSLATAIVPAFVLSWIAIECIVRIV